MILNIPNSGVLIPTKWDGNETVENEIVKNTEWFTAELFGGDKVKSLIFPYSNIYCDVSEDDREKVCRTTTSDNRTFRTISSDEREYILSEYYERYFDSLEEMIKEEIEEKGFSIVIDCRSFVPDRKTMKADICLGIDASTPKPVFKAAKQRFKSDGFSVQTNKTVIGAVASDKYRIDTQNVFALRISVNKNLYLNMEEKVPKIKAAEFRKIYSSITKFIEQLDIATKNITAKHTA